MKMPHIDEEKELYAISIQGSVQDFLFGGGELIPEKFLEPRSGEEIFLGLVRGPGACSHGKFWKHSVQDWLKSHFWILVTFTDSLYRRQIRSVFETAFNLFSGKTFFGGGSFPRRPSRQNPAITKSAPCVHREHGAVLWSGLVYFKVTRQSKRMEAHSGQNYLINVMLCLSNFKVFVVIFMLSACNIRWHIT